MKTSVVILFVVATATLSLAMNLPSTFRTCNRRDPQYSECLNNAVRDAVVSLAGGLKSFKILPIEPLAVDSVNIGKSEGSVTLRQEYRNIKVHGLTKGLKVMNYHVDWDKMILSSDSMNPQVDFVADYKVDGKILLLPVKGSGKCNITMYDLKTHTDIYCEKYEKNGETYLKVRKYNVEFSPARVAMQFDNLFDGDTVLGEQMNRFINENSDILFKELQGPYEETFGLVFTKISNDVFSRIPMDKIFPPA